ncbi:restriction endonuclease subunit R [Plantibacter flavus]|uniref:DEAD/DEAH box helicase family protein n=1 Tax=Plantibacter flavus TaxID=150123 RepID=UPI00099DA951|nr:DEAD/DEAH box helicase family protein [Plantibacter flavus]AQX78699.1 restriction endonuclease subunit R [Plantibacter flavus]
MGNFDFVQHTQPQLFEDARRAESYVTTDPRSAAIYARRTAELLVSHLFKLWQLPEPYQPDFAARVHDPAFAQLVPQSIRAKLNLIRKNGNNAVHRQQAVPVQVAGGVLAELFHVLVWAGFHHSPHPELVPTTAQFDPKLAAQSAPLSRTEVAELARRFKQQDEAYVQALAAKDELLAQVEAENARLRGQIAAAQQQTALSDDHDYTEADTRVRLIDELLLEVGWQLSDDRDREYHVTGMPNSSGDGYVDYVLWGADGKPLAIVEAKRTTSSIETGRQQALLYADRLEAQTGQRPVIFLSNGYEHRIWDDASGYAPRAIEGFYSRDELELMVQRRTARKPLSAAGVNADIAGRPYQQRAIRAIGSAFDHRQRKALLVMATGSGKTRTTIALVDQLMREGWVKRVLFLADRSALVRQAAGEFTKHLPQVATVNLVADRAGNGRVFASTYPTMLNLINQVDDGARRFGPGYFDVIVIDEAHRSVYDKYGAIFDYFDSLLVGLTATPKDEVDHNTYGLFELEDGVPTDAYTLDEAVAEGHLVPPRGVSVGTKFLRSGIRYDDLTPEEKDQWDLLDWGDEVPDEIGAEELNRFLFNTDTVDKVLATLMEDGYKVAGGDRLAKTIIFAKSQAHAEFISERFDASFPEYAGRFARVITHSVTYAQQLIDDFSDPDKLPQIAISVDMLDTGIDVPDVANLVFFKAVRSKAKFWQMIGRGTRLRPGLFAPGRDKQDFLVFDFCGNFEYFNQDLPETAGSTQKSLTQRIFETRVGLITTLGSAHPELRRSNVKLLREFVAGMNLSNVVVRKHRAVVEQFSEEVAWTGEDGRRFEGALVLGGLPSAVRDDDEFAKRFDLLILRRQLAQLEGDAFLAERQRETIQALAQTLLGKLTIPSVAQHAELLEAVAGDEWWHDVTLPMLELLRLRVRGLARFVDRHARSPVYTDFEDEMSEQVEVHLNRAMPGTDLARFRDKAMSFLRSHLDHVALQRLHRNLQLTDSDLGALESMLVDAQIGSTFEIEYVSREEGLGVFIRSLVGLDRAAATEAFARYLDRSRFTVQQIRFVQLVIEDLTANGIMSPTRLFESPFTDSAPTGPGELFTMDQMRDIVDILDGVRSTAVPA